MTTVNTFNIPKRAGRVDFSFDLPELASAVGAGAVFLSDAPDGPLAMFITLPPNIVAPPHSHDCDYITVIIEGSIRVGKIWYERGSIRVQEKGSVYGPALTGPEGVKTIVFMADRRGLPDRFSLKKDREQYTDIIAALEVFANAGGKLPLPGFMTGSNDTDTRAGMV